MVGDIIESQVNKGNPGVLVCRLVDVDGDPLVQSDIQSMSYTATLIDETDPTSESTITGHTDVSLVVADTVYDTLQTNAAWTEKTGDANGYNCLFEPDVSVNQLFEIIDARYWVRLYVMPVLGQRFVQPFRITVRN